MRGDERKRRLWILLSLYAICVILLLFKTFVFCDVFSAPMLFRTEGALHYHFTGQIVETGFVPVIDLQAQYPEGMAVYRETPLLMEYVAGYLYRSLSGLPIGLQGFLVLFKILIASLGAVGVFLVARQLSGSENGAIAASLLYSTSMAFYRTVLPTDAYQLENFALPLIFFGIYFLLKAMHDHRRGDALLAGSFMFLALASWQITQFFLLLVAGFFVIRLVLERRIDHRLYTAFGWFMLIPLIGGLLLPSLKDFALSPLLIVTFAVVVVNFATRRRRMSYLQRAAALILIIGFLLTVSFFLSSGDYTHVSSLLAEKALRFGQKPVDPADLPYEVRVYWTSIYQSPSLQTIAKHFGFIAVAIAAGFMMLLRKAFSSRSDIQLLLYLAVAFIPLYLLMTRMNHFLAFFLAPIVAFVFMPRLRKERWWRIAVIAAVVAIVSQAVFYLWLPANGSCLPYEYRYGRSILTHTESDAVILTDFYFSPSLLAYYNRSVPIHSIFESAELRDKIKDFHFALSDDEETFHAYCIKHGVDYFLYDRDFYQRLDPSSLRYLTDSLEPLPANAALVRFESLMDKSVYFELVDHTGQFALFAVR
ncbi:MAG: STT3 domain-containing protein [archaeon]